MTTVTATVSQARDAAGKLNALASLVERAENARVDIPDGAFIGVTVGSVTVHVRP